MNEPTPTDPPEPVELQDRLDRLHRQAAELATGIAQLRVALAAAQEVQR